MVHFQVREIKLTTKGDRHCGAWETLKTWSDNDYATMTRKYGSLPLQSMGTREYRIIKK